ncbi:MAG TPA: hypothetical protein VFD73_09805 [Gemmatimonadales bacterium]|nr:hypothetical protein [Gemmatimonadales bacterium]
MLLISQLHSDAVDYAADLIKAGVDYQIIEWNLLNQERFAPLVSSFDIEDLYDGIQNILSCADDQVEDERLRNEERAWEYERDYPEPHDVQKWER